MIYSLYIFQALDVFLLLKNPSIENTNADQLPVFVAFLVGAFNDVRVTGIYRGALLLSG